MAEDQKKYVDSEALNIFLGKLKDKLNENSASSFTVNYARTAGTANQLAHTLTIKNSDGSETLGTFDGSDDVVILVSNEGGSSPVEGALNLKFIIGTQENPTLPVGYIAKTGDVIICVADITETQGAEEVVVFKGGSEYVYDGSKWVELGTVVEPVDLSGYATTSDLTNAINGLSSTYAAKSDVYTKDDVYTKTEADGKYLTSSALDGYATTQGVETALGDYSTTSQVERYVAGELADYLTSDDASSTYETSAHASETFETKTNAESTYETKSNAEATYETKTNAESTYETKSNATATYETKSNAEATYETKANAEATYETKTDAADTFETKAHAEETFVDKKDYVTNPDINKLFPVDYEGSTPADFGDALSALGAGGALNVDKAVVGPNVHNWDIQLGDDLGDAPVDIVINLGENGSLTAGEGSRVFSIGPYSKLEINGGEIFCENDGSQPAILIANNCVLKLNNVELTSDTTAVIQSQDDSGDSEIYISGCTIHGANYFPACKSLVIENSIFVGSDTGNPGPICFKAGSLTIRNSHFTASSTHSGAWKHSPSGWYGIASALVIENCNAHGNVTGIDIDAASTFTAEYTDTTSEAGYQKDGFGILIINYNGNECTGEISIAQDYYTIDITEETAQDHYFTKDGRGDTEQPSLVKYNG